MQKLQSSNELFGNCPIKFMIVNVFSHKRIQIAPITKLNEEPEFVAHQMTGGKLAFQHALGKFSSNFIESNFRLKTVHTSTSDR